MKIVAKRMLLFAFVCMMVGACEGEKKPKLNVRDDAKGAARPESLQSKATLREVLRVLRSRDPVHTAWVLPVELMARTVSVPDLSDVNALWDALRKDNGLTIRVQPSGRRVVFSRRKAEAPAITILPGQPEGTWERLCSEAGPPGKLVRMVAPPRTILSFLRDIFHAAIRNPLGSDPRGTVPRLVGDYDVSLPRMHLGEALMLLADAWDLDVSVVDGRILFESRKHPHDRQPTDPGPPEGSGDAVKRFGGLSAKRGQTFEYEETKGSGAFSGRPSEISKVDDDDHVAHEAAGNVPAGRRA